MKNVAFGGQNVNSSSGGTAGLQTYNVDSTLENVQFINNSSAAQQGWNMGGALAVHKTAELGPTVRLKPLSPMVCLTETGSAWLEQQ